MQVGIAGIVEQHAKFLIILLRKRINPAAGVISSLYVGHGSLPTFVFGRAIVVCGCWEVCSSAFKIRPIEMVEGRHSEKQAGSEGVRP